MMEDTFVFDLGSTSPVQDDSYEGIEEDILSDLMDELILGFCFETHRACKVGTLFIDETDEDNLKEFEIIDEPGRDVFGQLPSKKQVECICPNCNRNLSASRFAPHLEKCMGMGRNSSRLASKRIANSGLKDDDEDDDRDIDWSFAMDKKSSKKQRKDKLGPNSPRRSRKGNRNGRPNWYNEIGVAQDAAGVLGTDSQVTYKQLGAHPPGYDAMSLEDRKHLLMTTCGVISEKTKKMCTKSLRCPQHSDEQRRHVRRYLLGIDPEEKTRLRPDGTVVEGDEIHVDIDSYEDGDGQALRDTLNRLQWDQPATGGNSSTNPSPADSTSTTNSNEGGKRRKKGSKLTHRKKSKKPGVLTLVSSTTSSSPIPTYEIID